MLQIGRFLCRGQGAMLVTGPSVRRWFRSTSLTLRPT